MKKVLEKKRKYNFKDLLRWFIYIIIHYVSIFIYIGILVLIKLYIFNVSIQKNIIKNDYLYIYTAVIAPSINFLLHMIYKEKGFTNFKAALWLHSLFLIILIPIALFFVKN